MKVKCKVNFYPEKRKDDSGQLSTENVPLFMYFTYSGRRLQYFTGYRLNLRQWNPDTQRMRPNSFNKSKISATVINGHLDELSAKVQEIHLEQLAQKKIPSVHYIREELKRRMNDKQATSNFFEVFNIFIETASVTNSWTKGTKVKFNTIMAQLKEFQEQKHFRLEFDSIDESFFNKYHAFLIKDHGHRNSTLSKNLKILKWFLNWAADHGYNNSLAYKKYNPEFKGVKGSQRIQKIIFLRWDELMLVYNKEIKQDYLARVRDTFCFQCFTGLRYSDVYNLKRYNVKEDSIKFTSIKTDETLEIMLNQYSKAILDKYRDFNFTDDKCLPVISNQKMNEYLKEVGKACGLTEIETVVYFVGNDRKEDVYEKWELLTSHVGRKSFVTNAIFFNIPAEVIMSWTGHKDHKVLENYYKITVAQQRREMLKFGNDKT